VPIDAPAGAINDAQAGAAAAGYPDLWPLLLAIARYESTWRTGAVGDNGCSLGYLQFNQCGGLGAGHGAAELFDGVANMRLGAQIIGDRLAAGWSLRDALRDWTTRDLAIPLYYGYLDVLAGEPTPTPSPPPAPPPSSPPPSSPPSSPPVAEPPPATWPTDGAPVPVSVPPARGAAIGVLVLALLTLWVVVDL
jgi:hypothetical protein